MNTGVQACYTLPALLLHREPSGRTWVATLVALLLLVSSAWTLGTAALRPLPLPGLHQWERLGYLQIPWINLDPTYALKFALVE